MSVNGPNNNTSTINFINNMIRAKDANNDGKITGEELKSITDILTGAKESLTAADYEGVLKGWGIEHQAAPEFEHVATGDNKVNANIDHVEAEGNTIIAGNGNHVEDGTSHASGNNTVGGTIRDVKVGGDLVIGGNGNFVDEEDDEPATANAKPNTPTQSTPKQPPKTGKKPSTPTQSTPQQPPKTDRKQDPQQPLKRLKEGQSGSLNEITDAIKIGLNDPIPKSPKNGGVNPAPMPEPRQPKNGGVNPAPMPEPRQPKNGGVNPAPMPEVRRPKNGGVNPAPMPELRRPKNGGVNPAPMPEPGAAETIGRAIGKKIDDMFNK